MKIIFVGCNPSPKNADSRVPFVGTRSGSIFFRWTEELGLSRDQYEIINVSSKVTKSSAQVKKSDISLEQVAKAILLLSGKKTKIITLGTMAAWALEQLKIDHFSLPHPSGLNRKLNDKNFAKEQLRLCKKYLRSDSTSDSAKPSA